MPIDSNSVLTTGYTPIIIKGYGFKCSSGPAQGTDVPKADGVEEDWYFVKGHKLQPCVALPAASSEVSAFTNNTVVVGVPDEVMGKLRPDLGNNSTKKFDFVVTTYQAIESAKVVPAIKSTFTLSGIDSKAMNTVCGALTGTAKVEVFNEQGVNKYSLNIDTIKQTVGS